MHRYSLFPLTAIAFLAACSAPDPSPVTDAQDPQPPIAQVRPTELEAHGDVRVDNYYWLRERQNPQVIEYLEAENAYTDAVMAHTEALQEELFEEIVDRIKEDDESVPYPLHDRPRRPARNPSGPALGIHPG